MKTRLTSGEIKGEIKSAYFLQIGVIEGATFCK